MGHYVCIAAVGVDLGFICAHEALLRGFIVGASSSCRELY